MNIKQFLTLMIIGTLLFWAMFLIVIFNMPPENYMPLVFFYLSLFLALIGTLAIIGLGIRMLMLKNGIVFKEVKNSFRQSFLLSILVISALFLESRNNLAWWNMLLLVLALAILECLFSPSRKSV